MIPIIGFSGRAGSGKSTAADYLVQTYGYTRMRFAQRLKDMCRALGLTSEQIDGGMKEVPDPRFGYRTPRYLMQTLGTEWGRNLVHESIWLDLTMDDAKRKVSSGGLVVIDDVRFPNEVAAIRAAGGIIIELRTAGDIAKATHISEQHELPRDWIIRNDMNASLFLALDEVVAREKELAGIEYARGDE